MFNRSESQLFSCISNCLLLTSGSGAALGAGLGAALIAAVALGLEETNFALGAEGLGAGAGEETAAADLAFAGGCVATATAISATAPRAASAAALLSPLGVVFFTATGLGATLGLGASTLGAGGGADTATIFFVLGAEPFPEEAPAATRPPTAKRATAPPAATGMPPMGAASEVAGLKVEAEEAGLVGLDFWKEKEPFFTSFCAKPASAKALSRALARRAARDTSAT